MPTKSSNVTTSSTSKQTVEPPAFLKPFLEDAVREAQRQFRSDAPQFFPGQTFVDPSPETISALDLTRARALAGSPLTQAAQQNAIQTLAGDFANPFFQQAFDAQTAPLIENFQNTIAPGINSAFIGAGRSGSPANQQVLGDATNQFTRNLAQVGGNLAFQNFENERGRQLQALGISPVLANVDFDNLARLGAVGAAREGISLQPLQEDINRFNFEQTIDQQKLRELVGLLGAVDLGSTTTGQTTNTRPVFSNPFATGLGGVLSAASIAAPFFSGGFGGAGGVGAAQARAIGSVAPLASAGIGF